MTNTRCAADVATAMSSTCSRRGGCAAIAVRNAHAVGAPSGRSKDLPAAGAVVEPGPHLHAESVAEFGDAAADDRGPVEWAAGQVPQGRRLAGLARADLLPVDQRVLAQRFQVTDPVQGTDTSQYRVISTQR